jgi:hypothetical protein
MNRRKDYEERWNFWVEMEENLLKAPNFVKND